MFHELLFWFLFFCGGRLVLFNSIEYVMTRLCVLVDYIIGKNIIIAWTISRRLWKIRRKPKFHGTEKFTLIENRLKIFVVIAANESTPFFFIVSNCILCIASCIEKNSVNSIMFLSSALHRQLQSANILSSRNSG